MPNISRKKVLISGALMALWVASLIPQADAVNAALGEPPGTYSGASWPIGVALGLLQIPGFIAAGIVCVTLRGACSPGHFLGSDSVNLAFIFLGNAATWMVVTLPLANAVQKRAWGGRGRVATGFTAAGIVALLANTILMVWMIGAGKPYYTHPTPVLSVLSLVFGAAFFYSLSPRNTEIGRR